MNNDGDKQSCISDDNRNHEQTGINPKSIMNNSYCWIDGVVVNPQEATISVFDHGLLYGDGVFEGIRFYKGKMFRLEAHLSRLRDSLAALSIRMPYSDTEIEAALNKLIQLSLREKQDNAYIRLLVTRGVGSLGIDPRSCVKSSVIMILSPLQLASSQEMQQGLKLMVSTVRRISNDMLSPQIKSLNYLNNILARQQATVTGADEAIMLNAQGFVAEASTENIFVIKNGMISTPAITEGVLAGITRAEVIKLADAIGFEVSQTRLTVHDLYTADEVFLTGTGAELIPVREIDGHLVSECPGPIYIKLKEKFECLFS